MAVVLQTLKDSDFEHVVKVTTTGTNSAASIVDASALAGADTNPRLSIVSCTWTVGSQQTFYLTQLQMLLHYH